MDGEEEGTNRRQNRVLPHQAERVLCIALGTHSGGGRGGSLSSVRVAAADIEPRRPFSGGVRVVLPVRRLYALVPIWLRRERTIQSSS